LDEEMVGVFFGHIFVIRQETWRIILLLTEYETQKSVVSIVDTRVCFGIISANVAFTPLCLWGKSVSFVSSIMIWKYKGLFFLLHIHKQHVDGIFRQSGQ